jgi:anti-sigma factor RsiW
MTDREMLSRLDRYIDDELSREERLEFESRLGDSPELSAALGERRAAMGLLTDWADELAAPRRTRLTLGWSVRLAVAAAAAIAAVAVPLGLSRSERVGNEVSRKPETGLTMRSMEEGVEVRSDSDGAVELVVDPFPMKWRTLNNGVQVLRSKSEESDELLVDPFPEEG